MFGLSYRHPAGLKPGTHLAQSVPLLPFCSRSGICAFFSGGPAETRELPRVGQGPFRISYAKGPRRCLWPVADEALDGLPCQVVEKVPSAPQKPS